MPCLLQNLSGDPFDSCPFARTHTGKCHTREGYQRAYVPSEFPSLPGRSFKVPCCPESIGTPYCQPNTLGLSCKWVTGPGGMGYFRCDNYQSYKDVAVNGEILNPFEIDGCIPQFGVDLTNYMLNAGPVSGKTFCV